MGGVEDLSEELGKTFGRKPFFEYPPILYDPLVYFIYKVNNNIYIN